MTKGKLIGSLLTALVTTPIWLYLLYKILKAVSASELMWFLYWIYVPVLFIAIMIFLATTEDKK